MGKRVNIPAPPTDVNQESDAQGAVSGRLDVSVPIPLWYGGSPSYGAGELTRTEGQERAFLVVCG